MLGHDQIFENWTLFSGLFLEVLLIFGFLEIDIFQS